MDITEASILHHVGIVLFLLWLLSSFDCCHPFAYFVSFVYLYLIHDRYVMRLRRKVKFEEKRQASKKRVLTDSETVRWLNYVVENMWPVCMEQIVSQKILLPIIPWFLRKYQPWTVKKSLVQHLYMGRCPPMFTEMRVLRQSTDDDHLVLELGMNFRTADDMSAILAVKLRKRLGFGMWAKLHLTGMHVEGKVLIGVKFIRRWPFLGRLRVCFVEPPYFQMTVKPIFTHGIDVTVLPGIAGWLDKLLAVAFEQTLVEPNMLVVDVEKFASPGQEDWFSIDAKEPIAHALVEVIEGTDMKPSDLNGLADPYVKGQIGPYRFRSKIRRKTLSPKWHEEFKLPICSWDTPNVLAIEVRDKDRFVDDTLGVCSVNISDLRDGQRHDMWLSLQNIKTGRLHLAVTVIKVNEKVGDPLYDVEILEKAYSSATDAAATAENGAKASGLPEIPLKIEDKFEPIDIDGQKETGLWVHHPGSEVAPIWEPRKGKSRVLDLSGNFMSPSVTGSYNDSSSTDESIDNTKTHNPVSRGLRKIASVFHRSPRNNDKSGSIEESVLSPYANVKALNEKEIGVKFVMEDSLSTQRKLNGGRESVDGRGGGPESPSKGHMKDMAKSIMKHAGKSARGIKHAMSRRGSTKSKGSTERDVSVESDSSDSSDEESFPSSSDHTLGVEEVIPEESLASVEEVIPVVSNNESSEANADVKQATPKGPEKNVALLSVEEVIPVVSNNESSKANADVKEATPKGPEMNVAEDSPINKVSDERNGDGLVCSNEKLETDK